MGSKSRQSQSSAMPTSADSSPGVSNTVISQTAGNAAAQERLSLANTAAGDTGAINDWGLE